jgi:hypothetical protein
MPKPETEGQDPFHSAERPTLIRVVQTVAMEGAEATSGWSRIETKLHSLDSETTRSGVLKMESMVRARNAMVQAVLTPSCRFPSEQSSKVSLVSCSVTSASKATAGCVRKVVEGGTETHAFSRIGAERLGSRNRVKTGKNFGSISFSNLWLMSRLLGIQTSASQP